jgi:hypothetical protein
VAIIGDGVVSPLIGNQQLVQGDALFTFARKLAISAGTSVYFLSGICKRRSLCKTKIVTEIKRFCRVVWVVNFLIISFRLFVALANIGVFYIPVRSSPCRLYRLSPPLGCNPSILVYPAQIMNVEFLVSGSICRSAVKNAEFISMLPFSPLSFWSWQRHSSPQRTLLLQLLSHLTTCSLIVREYLVIAVVAQGYLLLLNQAFSISLTCLSPHLNFMLSLSLIHLSSIASQVPLESSSMSMTPW